ncbi:hypothetical protein PanWU01x14_244450 [Parasponia andersonii]|uniref:Uncharacterized protein n=1 Tax=Parasponia andersonii TaxID=3476 RepID=A0A2P5BFE6_PARAD|nr:hypothetical protein PanWU01x14_244450 [Parasponia andersonii]
MGGSRCARRKNLNLHYLTNFAYPRMTLCANNSLPFVKLELCLSTDSPLRCYLFPCTTFQRRSLFPCTTFQRRSWKAISSIDCNLRFRLRSSF